MLKIIKKSPTFSRLRKQRKHYDFEPSWKHLFYMIITFSIAKTIDFYRFLEEANEPSQCGIGHQLFGQSIVIRLCRFLRSLQVLVEVFSDNYSSSRHR